MNGNENMNELSEEEFIKRYNPDDYQRPSVTTDLLIFGMKEDYSGLKILLIKRGIHPYQGSWALPGGFIRENETAYQTAARELEEETGLTDLYLDQVYTFTKPDRDPRTRVISIAYMALVPELSDVKGDDDADDAAWFDLNFTDHRIVISNDEKDVRIVYNLKKETFSNGVIRYENYIPAVVGTESLAFDHIEIWIESVKKLREQIRYDNQAFCLVGKTFTLPEIQAVYETILGHPLYKKSFRDMINDRVSETGNVKTSKVKSGRKCKEYAVKTR